MRQFKKMRCVMKIRVIVLLVALFVMGFWGTTFGQSEDEQLDFSQSMEAYNGRHREALIEAV